MGLARSEVILNFDKLRNQFNSNAHIDYICPCLYRFDWCDKIKFELSLAINSFIFQISIRDLSITPTEKEFQKVQRLLSNHRDYLTSLFEECFLSISLLHIDLTVSRFGQHIVPWITLTCQNLDLFALLLPHSYLNDFARIVSRSPVKVRKFEAGLTRYTLYIDCCLCMSDPSAHTTS